LFARRGRRVELTAAGNRLLPWADRALDAVQQGLAYAREASVQQLHLVRLGGVPSLDSELIPQALKAFSSLYPGIEVSVLEGETGSTTSFEAMLQRQELDLAIGLRRDNRGSLEAYPLVNDPLVLMGPPGHELMSEKKIGFSRLRDQPFVAGRPGSGMRQWL